MNQSNHYRGSKFLAEIANESHEFIKSSPGSRHSKFKDSPPIHKEKTEEVDEDEDGEDQVNHKEPDNRN